MYLLDTNILSELVRRRPNPALMARLGAVPASAMHTSAVCVFELRYGAALHGGKELWDRIQKQILARLHVLPFDERVAQRAGDALAELKHAGRLIGIEDVLIAATALTHDLIAVTANVKHLERVRGLRIENWLA